MRRLFLALALAGMPAAAFAQSTPSYVGNDNRTHDAQGTFCVPSASRGCPGNDGNGNATSLDPNNASFTFAKGPLVAGTDYSIAANNGSTGTNTLFRAINVTCTASGSANLTLTGGGVLPYTFASGPSYQIAVVLKSIDAVPAGCVLYGLK